MKMKKAYIALLVGLSALCATGCNKSSNNNNNNSNNDSYNNPGNGNIVDDSFNHKVEGTTHILESTPNTTIFAEKGKYCNFKIYVDGTSENANRAASFIRKHFISALEIELEPVLAVKKTGSFDPTEKAIYVGCKDMYEKSGIVNNIDYKSYGYQLVSRGDGIFLNAVEDEAYSVGATRLLELLIGYQYYFKGYESYERAEENDVLTSYNFNDIEIPDYQFRLPGGYSDNDYRYGTGTTINPMVSTSDYPWIHNVWTLLGDKYNEHPEWFCEAVGFRPTDGSAVHQLCYTAHGQEESLNEMINETADRVIKLFIENPSKKIVTITAEDDSNYCKCDTCKTSIAKYKTEAGTIVQFLNRVEKIVLSYIENDGTYKGKVSRVSYNILPQDFDFTIGFFAYHNTVTAPANPDGNGGYRPIDESVHCNEHVGLLLAPSNAKFIYSFYDQRNEAIANECKAWASCCNRLMTYLYCLNFRGYTFPYNSFDADVENLKFFKELNSIWLFDSCSYENQVQPAFMEYKKFLINKGMINVNFDVDKMTKTFFKNVYGDAEETMFELYHSERAHCLSIADVYVGNINDDSMFEGDTGKERWPIGTLLNWWGLCDKALEEIAPLAITNKNRYEMIKRAIKIESITPRFAMIELHGDYYTKEEFLRLAKELKDDLLELKFTYIKEHEYAGPLQIYFDRWGV